MIRFRRYSTALICGLDGKVFGKLFEADSGQRRGATVGLIAEVLEVSSVDVAGELAVVSSEPGIADLAFRFAAKVGVGFMEGGDLIGWNVHDDGLRVVESRPSCPLFPRPCGLCAGLDFAHLFGQRPEGAVDVGVLVDSVDFPCPAAAALAFLVALDVGNSTANQALLGAVEGFPEVASHVFAAAGKVELLSVKRCRILAVACDAGGIGKGALLAFREHQARHLGDAVIHLREGLQQIAATIDHVLDDVALVWNANLGNEGLRNNQTIFASATVDAGGKLIAAGSIVAVEHHDFVVKLALHEGHAVVTEAKEMLRETALCLVPAAALHDSVRAETLLSEAGQKILSGDVGVAIAAAVVSLFSEDTGSDAAKVVSCDGLAALEVEGTIGLSEAGRSEDHKRLICWRVVVGLKRLIWSRPVLEAPGGFFIDVCVGESHPSFSYWLSRRISWFSKRVTISREAL